MNTYNDYGFNDGAKYYSGIRQIRHDINHLRIDVKESIDAQTEQQKSDANEMRINQTTLFGKLIDTLKSIFTGKNDTGTDESFYKMVMRENNETQAAIASQEKSSADKLSGIITSLNTISSDIEKDTSGDSTNAKLIQQAINNLKTVSFPS